MLSAGIALYTLLWARSIVGSRITSALYALGLAAQALTEFSRIATNPWKYGLALPVAVLFLVIARSRLQGAFVLSALAGFSLIVHFRSFAGACAVALLVILIAPAESAQRRKIDLRLLLILPASVGVAYQVAIFGSLNGWFGAVMQSLALRQTRGGDVSLIVGARPEFAATLALFQARPVGFGPGVVPNSTDVSTAIEALQQLGADPDSKYINDYLFGGRLELHSIVGDLWLMFGFAGILLAVAIIWYLLAGLLDNPTRIVAGAVGLLVGISALWDMAFSPITALRYVVLASALLLPLRAASAQTAHHSSVPRGESEGQGGMPWTSGTLRKTDR